MKDVDNVRVVVRSRPLNDKEVETSCKVVVKVSIPNIQNRLWKQSLACQFSTSSQLLLLNFIKQGSSYHQIFLGRH